MSELEQTPGTELVIPVTGQIVDLTDLPAVAGVLDDLRQAELQIRDIKRVLTDTLVTESARTGASTFHFDHHDVQLSSGEETVHDLERMREELADAGLPEHRLDELIVATITYKLDGNQKRMLAGANPVYAGIINACTSKQPKTRYATVTRR